MNEDIEIFKYEKIKGNKKSKFVISIWGGFRNAWVSLVKDVKNLLNLSYILTFFFLILVYIVFHNYITNDFIKYGVLMMLSVMMLMYNHQINIDKIESLELRIEKLEGDL